jgi:hypothetical protein
MLRNISLLVAATAIAGCNGSTSPPPPTSPSPAAAPVTAVDTPAPPTSTTAVPPPAAPPPTRADTNVATINAMNAAISAGDAKSDHVPLYLYA